MKKLFSTLLLAVMAMAVFTACDDKEDEYTVTGNYSDCFYFITDLNEGTDFVKTEAAISASYTYHYGDKVTCTATLSIKNVPTSSGSYSDVVLKDLPVKIENMLLVIDVQNVAAFSDRNITFNKLKLVWNDRNINNRNYPVIQLDYAVNNKYEVSLIAKHYYLFGETTVTGADNVKYTDKQMVYLVTLDPEKNDASLYIQGAKFAENMPMRLDMTFPGISYTLTHAGYTLSCAELTPTIEGTPFPMYTIINLSGLGTTSGNLNLTFDVKDRGTVSTQLTPVGAL